MNRLAARGLLAALLYAAAGQVFALDPSLLPSQYVLDNWQIPDGLPQSTAQAVARTPDGYLWIGTQEGLARFDGAKFTVFDSATEPAIPNKDICALLVDRAGRGGRDLHRRSARHASSGNGRRPAYQLGHIPS